MKMLIAGSRDITDYKFWKPLFMSVPHHNEIAAIISGGARGADAMAKMLAEDTGLPYVEFPAEWDKLGKKAGFVRNVDMVNACDFAIVLWDGSSKGTAHTLKLLDDSGKPYLRISMHNTEKKNA